MNFWNLIFLDELRQAKSFPAGKISLINREKYQSTRLIIKITS